MSLTLHEKPSGTLPPCPNPDVKATLHLKAEDVEHVQEVLPPSYLPCLDARPGAHRSWQSTEVPFKDAVRLKSFCSQRKLSPRSVLQLAWALVLRCYVGNPSVCFACHSLEGTWSTLDSTAKGRDESICKVDFQAETPLLELLEEVEKQNSRRHAPGTKAQTFPPEHMRSPQGIPANTGLLLQEDSSQDWPDIDGLMAGDWGDDSSIDVGSNPSSSSEAPGRADTD